MSSLSDRCLAKRSAGRTSRRIDAAAEKARLEKSVGKLTKDVGGLEGRLKNPKFRENASAEVIEETEDNARARREELTRLEAALSRLAELA